MRKAWIFKALCCGWEPAEHNFAGVLPLCHLLQEEASKAFDYHSAPFSQKYICYGWNRLLGLMCKCCPLLKYPKHWFENCMVSWFLSNSLILSRVLALWFLSVLSLSCIWVPACCRFGSSLCWAESTELLAVARETHQPTEQSFCSRAQDLVSLHPILWCCVKTPWSLFHSKSRFYFWVDASKEHKQGTFSVAAAGGMDGQWEMQLPTVQAVTPYHIHGVNDLAFLVQHEALGFALLLLRLGRGLNWLE